jgi:predicted permease
MWFKRRDPRIGEEIRFHRDRLIADYVAAGMAPDEARRRASLELGNVSEIEEAVRDVRGRWLEDLAQDVRYALRTLRRNPAFAAAAVLSLTLGIGANTAIFSIVNAVMLRTLPVDEPDRLVQIVRLTPEGARRLSYPIFEMLRDNARSLSGLFAQRATTETIVIDGRDDFVTADLVSDGYFEVLGLPPAAGRVSGDDDDDTSRSSPAAVISDRYWQRRFGRSPAAIGTSLTIGDRVFTIVGVTPPEFMSAQAGRAVDLVLPLATMMGEQQRQSVGSGILSVMGRLKPGASVEQASAEVQVLVSSFLKTRSVGLPEKQRAAILLERAAALSAPGGINPTRETLERPLLILMGIVGLILLLACVNLSGLLVARAEARQREISVRLAIGAGHWRLGRQFLTESLVLALMGGLLGFGMAAWLSERLFAQFIGGSGVELSVAPDWRVLAFTAGASVVSCVLAGFLPALQAVRGAVNPALKEVSARGHTRLGKALVIAQLATSMVLVVGATLFVGTLVKLYALDPGFERDRVLVLNVRSLQPHPPARGMVLGQALIERLKAVPGVQAVSAAQILPALGGLWDQSIQVEGYTFRPGESNFVGFNAIAPGYFTALGTRLLSGREFTGRDTAASPKVAIVNERFARQFFGNASAIGRQVTSLKVTYEIVGVVRDAKYQHLRDDIVTTMYIPWTQRDGEQALGSTYLARAASGDPMSLLPDVERAVRVVDPGLRLQRAAPYATFIGHALSTERLMATLGGLFGLLALVIAGLGVFGVLAFQVARRTNELGVRVVLGARRRSMMGLVLKDVAWLTVPGIAIGAGIALLLTDLARQILFDFAPGEAGVFAVSASVLALTALLAGWLPARRAARVDPLVALRHE